MLVLLSFILSWGELWFLDFRVLPLEMKAREIMEHFEGDDERTPLLVNTDSGMLQRYVDGSLWDGSVANFYSPLESPEDSGDEVEDASLVTVPKKFKRKTPLNSKVLTLACNIYKIFFCIKVIISLLETKILKKLQVTNSFLIRLSC